MFASREYRRLLEAEEKLAADIANPQTLARDRSACARVLVAVIDMKRVIRMKPKPKDIDVSKAMRRTRSTPQAMPQPIEPPAADAA